MNIVIKVGGHCLNVDNAEDAERLIEQGGIALTEEEIVQAGMSGYEHLVSLLNTQVQDDGSIIFTPPQPVEPTLEDQLVAIEAKYASKIASLREAIMSAYLTDGETMDSNVAGLRAEWANTIAQRNAEMEALLI